MRYLGLDIGRRRIGLAIGETLAAELSTITCPKSTNYYDQKGYELAISEIKKLVDLEEVGGLVVGLPVNESGEHTEESKKIEKFSKKLEKDIGLTAHFVDETLTSFMAEELLLSQGVSQAEATDRVHQAAAKLILQQFLEENA